MELHRWLMALGQVPEVPPASQDYAGHVVRLIESEPELLVVPPLPREWPLFHRVALLDMVLSRRAKAWCILMQAPVAILDRLNVVTLVDRTGTFVILDQPGQIDWTQTGVLWFDRQEGMP